MSSFGSQKENIALIQLVYTPRWCPSSPVDGLLCCCWMAALASSQVLALRPFLCEQLLESWDRKRGRVDEVKVEEATVGCNSLALIFCYSDQVETSSSSSDTTDSDVEPPRARPAQGGTIIRHVLTKEISKRKPPPHAGFVSPRQGRTIPSKAWGVSPNWFALQFNHVAPEASANTKIEVKSECNSSTSSSSSSSTSDSTSDSNSSSEEDEMSMEDHFSKSNALGCLRLSFPPTTCLYYPNQTWEILWTCEKEICFTVGLQVLAELCWIEGGLWMVTEPRDRAAGWGRFWPGCRRGFGQRGGSHRPWQTCLRHAPEWQLWKKCFRSATTHTVAPMVGGLGLKDLIVTQDVCQLINLTHFHTASCW